jgi:hypothetical protein
MKFQVLDGRKWWRAKDPRTTSTFVFPLAVPLPPPPPSISGGGCPTTALQGAWATQAWHSKAYTQR